MTATQHIQLYNFFKQYLHVKDDAEVKVFVEQVEQIVEQKFDKEKDNFASMPVVEKIDMLRQEMKTAIAEVKSKLKSEINKLIMWMVGIIFMAAAFFFALAKFIHKSFINYLK